MRKLNKVISGGQIGADTAGLLAAERCGIKTGGWMPKGFKTKRGKQPMFAQKFGLLEHESGGYPPRTFSNAKDSDGTIRIAKDFSSPGEKCTLKAIKQYDKPYIDVPYESLLVRESRAKEGARVIKWITDNAISTLNVAGNADLSIESTITIFLMGVFKRVNA